MGRFVNIHHSFARAVHPPAAAARTGPGWHIGCFGHVKETLVRLSGTTPAGEQTMRTPRWTMSVAEGREWYVEAVLRQMGRAAIGMGKARVTPARHHYL
jgi:hypothetical protein